MVPRCDDAPPHIPANQFERAGRAIKVGRLLRGLDVIVRGIRADEPSKLADDIAIARWLETMSREDRARVCVLSGVRLASDTTWAALIDAVFERQAIADRFGDAEDLIK